MPEVIGMTLSQRNDNYDKVVAHRIRKILHSYLEGEPVSVLAEVMHMKPVTLQRKFRGYTKWDVPTLIRICDILNVSNEDRSRMLGGTIK